MLERRWFQVSRFACEPESVISSTKSTFGDPCGVYHRLSDENLKALAILNSRQARYKRPELAILSAFEDRRHAAHRQELSDVR